MPSHRKYFFSGLKFFIPNNLKDFVAEVTYLFFLQNQHKTFGKTMCTIFISNLTQWSWKITIFLYKNNLH
jgi:hypothetical protein